MINSNCHPNSVALDQEINTLRSGDAYMNGVFLGAKPLPEPMSTDSQLDLKKQCAVGL